MRPVHRWSAEMESSLVLDGCWPMLVTVTALEAPTATQVRRLGFMSGQIVVPDDFDRMGSTEIDELFGGRG